MKSWHKNDKLQLEERDVSQPELRKECRDYNGKHIMLTEMCGMVIAAVIVIAVAALIAGVIAWCGKKKCKFSLMKDGIGNGSVFFCGLSDNIPHHNCFGRVKVFENNE